LAEGDALGEGTAMGFAMGGAIWRLSSVPAWPLRRSASLSSALRFLPLIAVLAAGVLVTRQLLAPATLQLSDLDERRVSVISDSARATVIIFTRTDCPVSNRYAPVVRQLHEAFVPRGIAFLLVYPDPRETPDMIRAHLKDYAYPCPALRDPSHELVKKTGATVTPEAAVFLANGFMVYRGRIDDRHVSLGLSRGAAGSRDLEDVLTAIVEGRHIEPRTTPAVGCFIADTQ
jgi:hypothetical protein